MSGFSFYFVLPLCRSLRLCRVTTCGNVKNTAAHNDENGDEQVGGKQRERESLRKAESLFALALTPFYYGV